MRHKWLTNENMRLCSVPTVWFIWKKFAFFRRANKISIHDVGMFTRNELLSRSLLIRETGSSMSFNLLLYARRGDIEMLVNHVLYNVMPNDRCTRVCFNSSENNVESHHGSPFRLALRNESDSPHRRFRTPISLCANTIAEIAEMAELQRYNYLLRTHICQICGLDAVSNRSKSHSEHLLCDILFVANAALALGVWCIARTWFVLGSWNLLFNSFEFCSWLTDKRNARPNNKMR